MPIFGDPLVPAAPRRPGPHTLHALLGGQHETPEEATHCADTPRHTSPREALKAVRLLRGEPWAIFFTAELQGGGRPAARSTAPTPHGPGDRPRPARPPPHCILGQTAFALGLLNGPPPVQWSIGYRPPAPPVPARSPAGQTRRTPCAPWGRSASGAPRATDASATAPASPGNAPSSHPSEGLWRRRQHAIGTPLSRQRRQEGLHRRWPAGTPDVCFPRDGQDRGVGVFFQPPPPWPMLPLPPRSRHPGGRDARVAGTPACALRVVALVHAVGPERSRSSQPCPWGRAEVKKTPLGPCALRPAVPLS